MNLEKSCGAVLFTRMNQTIKYVLVQSLKGYYGFPKGHIKVGETELETALREINEEVQIKPTIIEGFKAMDEYKLTRKKNTKKQVVFFLAEYENQEIIPLEDELLGATLVDYDDAMKLLTHESNRMILKLANDFIMNENV